MTDAATVTTFTFDGPAFDKKSDFGNGQGILFYGDLADAQTGGDRFRQRDETPSSSSTSGVSRRAAAR